jgi:deoxyribonuclease V
MMEEDSTVQPWPVAVDELIKVQIELGSRRVDRWFPPAGRLLIGACFVCFEPGPDDRFDEPAWAAAALSRNRHFEEAAVVAGRAAGPYRSGLMALREGALLQRAVRALPELPEVLLVNATGRDHPRRAGLALHLGAVLDIPSVGVTHRTLAADGAEPGPDRAGRSPLMLDDEVVGYWLRTRAGSRPIAAHAGWRTDPDVAADVVMRATRRARTPEPMRRARRLARLARAGMLDEKQDVGSTNWRPLP